MIISGYDFLKSHVLSCWRKVETVCDVVISSGRVFQTLPATKIGKISTVASGLKLRHDFSYVPVKVLNTFVTLWHVAA